MGDAERTRPSAEPRRPAGVILVFAAAAVALAACASQTPPAPTGDPLTHGHSVWCGTNPPSGYCMYD